MSPGNPLASIRSVLALVVLLVAGAAVADASPRDVLVDYVPDGLIQGDYTVRELTGALRLVRGRDGDYESFADAVQMKIAEVLAGGHRSSERTPARPPAPPAAAPSAPPPPPVASPPAAPPPPPAPGSQGSHEVVSPPPPAASPVKPPEEAELPRLPERPGSRASEIAIPRPPPVQPGDGPPWAFLLLTGAATLLVAGGLGAAGWRRLRRTAR